MKKKSKKYKIISLSRTQSKRDSGIFLESTLYMYVDIYTKIINEKVKSLA